MESAVACYEHTVSALQGTLWGALWNPVESAVACYEHTMGAPQRTPWGVLWNTMESGRTLENTLEYYSIL